MFGLWREYINDRFEIAAHRQITFFIPCFIRLFTIYSLISTIYSMSIFAVKSRAVALPEWFSLAFSGVALLGIFDALFLTIHYYSGTPVPCSVTSGCETVLTSQYAVWFGIPLALIGVAYYLTHFILMTAVYMRQSYSIFIAVVILSSLGFAASVAFVGLQVFVIQALCAYCLLSAFLSTILFGLSVYGVFRYQIK